MIAEEPFVTDEPTVELVLCECGNVKTERAPACPRCLFLDQPLPMASAAAIVDALRAHRFLPLVELAKEIGVTDRNTLRTLQALRVIGRVDVIVESVEHERQGQSGWSAWWTKQGKRPRFREPGSECTVVVERNLWFLTDRRRSS